MCTYERRLCSATVLTQIRFIWAVRGQDDGRRTCVTRHLPHRGEKCDGVRIRKTNLTFKRGVSHSCARWTLSAHDGELWILPLLVLCCCNFQGCKWVKGPDGDGESPEIRRLVPRKLFKGSPGCGGTKWARLHRALEHMLRSLITLSSPFT